MTSNIDLRSIIIMVQFVCMHVCIVVCVYLCHVGLLKGEPVLRPAVDVVDLADVKVHLEELALHQAVS